MPQPLCIVLPDVVYSGDFGEHIYPIRAEMFAYMPKGKEWGSACAIVGGQGHYDTHPCVPWMMPVLITDAKSPVLSLLYAFPCESSRQTCEIHIAM